MVKHTLEIIGHDKAITNLTINGVRQKFKDTDRKSKICTYSSESQSVEVMVYETHQFTGKCWFLWWLLFYVISIGGIFDVKQNRHCKVTYCRFVINSKTDTHTFLEIQDIKKSNKFATITTIDGEMQEIANMQYYDEKAKKLRKRMNVLKVFSTLAIAIGVIVMLILL